MKESTRAMKKQKSFLRSRKGVSLVVLSITIIIMMLIAYIAKVLK